MIWHNEIFIVIVYKILAIFQIEYLNKIFLNGNDNYKHLILFYFLFKFQLTQSKLNFWFNIIILWVLYVKQLVSLGKSLPFWSFSEVNNICFSYLVFDKYGTNLFMWSTILEAFNFFSWWDNYIFSGFYLFFNYDFRYLKKYYKLFQWNAISGTFHFSLVTWQFLLLNIIFNIYRKLTFWITSKLSLTT